MEKKIIAIIEEQRAEFKKSKKMKSDLRAYNSAVAKAVIKLFKNKGKDNE